MSPALLVTLVTLVAGGLTAAPPPTRDAPRAVLQEAPALADVAVDERPGGQLPLALPFADEAGDRIALERIFSGPDAPPVLLVPGWFRCEMLCAVLAPNLRTRLRALEEWTPDEDYRVVLFSIDPREGPDDAAARRRQALRGGAAGWTFLTGDERAIDALTEAIGFRYRWDAETEQYSHAALTVAVSGDGRIARYLYGVDIDPDTLSSALAAAREHRPAGSLEQILVRCFRYVPALRRHADLIAGVLRGGGVLIVLGLAVLLATAARRAVDGVEEIG